jgi:pyruvate/2-oxoglutarate dehydrogenase complex dihydrolipoamide acyltransferase (E2) component
METPSTAVREPTRKIPLRGMRGMIADKMVASLHEAAQLTHHARADVSRLLEEKTRLSKTGVKVSVEDLLMLAVVRALKRHPEINGVVRDREVQLADRIDLSVAIALPGNLLVAPAIMDAASLDVTGLRAARQDLAARARANKLKVSEMTGGTFCVSNLGLTRVEQFTPILNAPQIGILGMGCIADRAVREPDGTVGLRPFVGLSLTFDHRAIDGAPAADVLTTICREVEEMSS